MKFQVSRFASNRSTISFGKFQRNFLPIRVNSCLRGTIGEPWNPYREVTQPEVHQNPRILARPFERSPARTGNRAAEFGLIQRFAKKHVEFQRNLPSFDDEKLSTLFFVYLVMGKFGYEEGNTMFLKEKVNS